jgi:formylmethanofuran dehydrogenase subunit E
MYFEGKPMTGHMEIEKVKCFCDGIMITDKCTFYDGSLQNFKEHGKCRYLLLMCNI